MEAIEKRCFVDMLRVRYSRVGRRKKGEVLDELSTTLQVGRRQARRLLAPREPGRPRKPDRRGRPGQYQDPEFKDALKMFWRTTGYMCSRHLKSAIPAWLPFVEAEKGSFREDVTRRLLKISAPTIDRLLKPYKALKGKSLTRSGGFRDEIPIQESLWDISVPGFLEADTVAHCGGSTMGEYINSLVMVDIAITWTEARAVYGKASGPIVQAIEDIENKLPFELLGYDSDNGTEMLNQHVLRYFRDERMERNRPPVLVTRSRAYRKNDNAHVEQRNDSLARRWLGYERLDFHELQPLVNYYYAQVVCPLMNHFFPSFKLKDKIRVKSRTRRIYANPETPYARVMESPHVPELFKQELKRLHEQLNPVELMKEEKLIRRRIDTALKRLRGGQEATGLLRVPAPPAAFLALPFPPTPPMLAPPSPGASLTELPAPSLPNNSVTNSRVSHPHMLPSYKAGT